MIARWIALTLLVFAAPLAQAETVNVASTFALPGTPKYAPGFTHFDYVNPDAPKGGSVTLAAIGTYDNFNRFSSRGNPASGTDTLYDRLFINAEDEPNSYYPLIALSVRYPDNYRWFEVTINPHARFHDGIPITAQDVAFTMTKFMTEGVPQFRVAFKGAKARTVSPLTVRFEVPGGDKDKMLSLLSLPVFPQHFWQHHRLDEPLRTLPPSSGPYRISAWKPGQSITWSRVKDYWAADLPVNKGRFNFDTLRYDYYLDDNVAFEAFKAGAVDFRTEVSAKKWATQYRGKNFSNKYIVKLQKPNTVATDAQWLALNVNRPQLSDRRVREALAQAFDFEWVNRALLYGANKRTLSYFQNTIYAARALPDSKELAILNPLRGKVPDEVFNQIYQPPITDGSGYDRTKLLTALSLLQHAGWVLKNQKLVNVATGKSFQLELLLHAGSNNQWVLPYQHNLSRLGITLTLNEVDSSQYQARARKRDYDMIQTVYPGLMAPDSSLTFYWGSAYLNASYNASGVSSKLVDDLLAQIVAHQEDEQALIPLGRALDRLLTWNVYMIPMWYNAEDRYAYWNKFSMPARQPPWSIGFNNWWYDAGKAAQLPTQRR